MYAYINMYNKLTNRVRALKSTSGLLSESSVRASRSRAIYYKINDEACGFHPVLYTTLYLSAITAVRYV